MNKFLIFAGNVEDSTSTKGIHYLRGASATLDDALTMLQESVNDIISSWWYGSVWGEILDVETLQKIATVYVYDRNDIQIRLVDPNQTNFELAGDDEARERYEDSLADQIHDNDLFFNS